MAYTDENLTANTSYPAGVDLSGVGTDSKLYLALELNSSGQVILCRQNRAPIGFLGMEARSANVGQQVTVVVNMNKHTAVASEAIAVGDLVNTEANGRLGKAANISGGGTQFIYGIAVEAAAAAGDQFKVQPIFSGVVG